MAQNITLMGASYSDVPAVTLPKTGGGTAEFFDARTVTYSLSGGASVSANPPNAIAGQGFTVKLKAPAGYNLSNVSVTMGGVDITSQVFTPDEQGGGGANLQTKSVSYTPTTSAQTETVTPDSGYDGMSSVSVSVGAIPSEYIVPTGTKSVTANGTGIDVANYAFVDVNVSGSSKNVQVVQGTTRTTSSSMTAIGAEMTVSKTGTYDVYWTGVRTNTSGSYTFATQLYIDGTAYGSENTTWSNHVQNVHLSNVYLTAGQKLRVYGRESRNSSYYMYAGTLIIVEA